MPRRGRFARRSAMEWVVRAALAIVVATLGYIVVTRSLASTVRSRDTDRAHALAPGDGRVTATLAASLSGTEATATDRKRADELARLALRQDPTAVLAASTLGINAQVRGQDTAALRLFTYAEKLSRRDFQTQLWAVEYAVGRGDVVRALRHYDIALRTSRSAADLLFPVLASAMGDPVIRAALGRTLAGRPGWGASFVDYVAGSDADARATAQLLAVLRRHDVPISEGGRAEVINRLIAGDFLADAWRLYASIRPGVDRRMSRDPRFTAQLTSPSPFDWVPINEGGLTVSMQQGNGGGIVDFAVPTSLGGPMLQQLQILPPGDYRLQGHSIGIDQSEYARPYWALTCRDGRELGRVAMPNSSQAAGVFNGMFRVPKNCPVQTLALVARPSDAVAGLVGQIDRVQLRPTR